MFSLGLVLLIAGVLLSIPVLYSLGFILLAAGLILWICGAAFDLTLLGRKHWF